MHEAVGNFQVNENEVFEWDSSYILGIEEIDNQHKKLFDILREMHSALYNDNFRMKSEECIKKIYDYTKFHLLYEENYFEQLGYPESEQHKKMTARWFKKSMNTRSK